MHGDRGGLPSGGRRRLGAALVAVVLLALGSAGCGGTPDGNASTTTPVTQSVPAARAPAPAVWTACTGNTALQCTTVTVPLDYHHPEGPSLSVAVAKATALDPAQRIGTLFFNPGVPGESGIQLLPVMLSDIPSTIRQRFDIVSFDPRGTGASDALDCGTSPAGATSQLPVPAAVGDPLPATPFFTSMAEACRSQQGALSASLDSTDTARDMDRIRAALGLPTISYYGMSYGTVLGSVYAELFPHRIRTMVLDGAVDVNATLPVQSAEQAPAAERGVVHLLSTCGGQSPCPLGADPIGAYRSLAGSLTAQPLPAPGNGDDVPVTVGDLDTATLFAASVPDFTLSYLAALSSAQHGNGGPLRQLALEFVTDINGASLVDPLWAITCNDAAGHPGPVAAGALAGTLSGRYPLIGGYVANYTVAGCVAWPTAKQPVEDIHPAGAPPTLVLGNTGDPNTPLVAAVHLAAAFPKASQLTWNGWGHTWLLSGGTDPCMRQRVTAYLVDGTLPPHGTVCP